MFKKLMLLLGVIALSFVGIAQAGNNYVATLSSFTVASDTTTFATLYPQISGGAVIDKLVFSTTNTISTPILIGLYDTCTSTTAATVDGYWIITGSNTFGGSNSVTIDYQYYNPLSVQNPGFFKADGNTGNKVYMNIQYR